MNKSEKLELVEEWFDKVWTKKRKKSIHDMFVPSRKNKKEGAHGLGLPDPLGPKEFEVFHGMLLKLIDKISIKIHLHADRDDWFALFATFKAVSKKSGKRVTMTGGGFIRIRNNKIVEAHNSWDFMSLFEQLGLLPKDALLTCLNGGKIGG